MIDFTSYKTGIYFGCTTKKKSRGGGFFFLYSSLFTLHFSLKSPRDFYIEEIREKREKVAFLLRLWRLGRKAFLLYQVEK